MIRHFWIGRLLVYRKTVAHGHQTGVSWCGRRQIREWAWLRTSKTAE